MKKFQIYLFLFFLLAIFTIIIIQYFISEENNSKSFEFEINFDPNNLHKIENDSVFFNVYGENENYLFVDGQRKYAKLLFQLKDDNDIAIQLKDDNDTTTQIKYGDLYEHIRYDAKQNAVVIYPSFTGSAYQDFGFYSYYFKKCDSSCLTVPITNDIRTEMGGNAIQILKLLNYNFLSDSQIDKNPELLKDYDKIILLHNEYVTKNQFDAITSHPKVIYLYPNALYAQVETDYEKNTITLVRGHSYPESSIANGFDWEFENTTYEYDVKCKDWNFYEIKNGYMLNCYPESILHLNYQLLRMINEI
jgi:hypothetical protein